MAALGIVAFVVLAWAWSEQRARVPWLLAAVALLLQVVIAFLMLNVPFLSDAIRAIASGVAAMLAASLAGARFIVGDELVNPAGATGFVLALQVLPVVILYSTVMSGLYHIGLMQRVIAGAAWLLQRTLRTTGEEAVCTAANVFVGMTEAPLCIRPYLDRLRRSEVMLMMSAGFATIAGSTLTAYVGMLGGTDPAIQAEFARHLITASVMSAPAAFMYARIMVPPEPDTALSQRPTVIDPGLRSESLVGALADGASQGLRLVAHIAGMLLATVALMALFDMALSLLTTPLGLAEPITLSRLLGWLFLPFALLMGIGWDEAQFFAALLGKKIVATEFVAYLDLAAHPDALSARSRVIASYALCGFANMASIGITIGILGELMPARRTEIHRLVFRAMCAGAMASWTTACVVSFLL